MATGWIEIAARIGRTGSFQPTGAESCVSMVEQLLQRLVPNLSVHIFRCRQRAPSIARLSFPMCACSEGLWSLLQIRRIPTLLRGIFLIVGLSDYAASQAQWTLTPPLIQHGTDPMIDGSLPLKRHALGLIEYAEFSFPRSIRASTISFDLRSGKGMPFKRMCSVHATPHRTGGPGASKVRTDPTSLECFAKVTSAEA